VRNEGAAPHGGSKLLHVVRYSKRYIEIRLLRRTSTRSITCRGIVVTHASFVSFMCFSPAPTSPAKAGARG
jgi:hypothetical protein